MGIPRGRLFAIVGFAFASLFVSRAFGGVVLVSRSSSLNYANNLGGVNYQKTSQSTDFGVYNNSISFNQSDVAGSRGCDALAPDDGCGVLQRIDCLVRTCVHAGHGKLGGQ